MLKYRENGWLSKKGGGERGEEEEGRRRREGDTERDCGCPETQPLVISTSGETPFHYAQGPPERLQGHHGHIPALTAELYHIPGQAMATSSHLLPLLVEASLHL